MDGITDWHVEQGPDPKRNEPGTVDVAVYHVKGRNLLEEIPL